MVTFLEPRPAQGVGVLVSTAVRQGHGVELRYYNLLVSEGRVGLSLSVWPKF